MCIKKTYLLFVSALLIALNSNAQSLVQYVQPWSGTAPSTTISSLKHSEAGSTEKNANTIPAVTLPFAMTQWTPQTRTTEIKCQPPYFYRDSLFSGIRGTHWISGSCTQDYGSFTIMPVVGNLKTSLKQYSVPFSHHYETTTPYYYELKTDRFIISVTPTLRAAIIRIQILQTDSLYLLVQPNSDESMGVAKADPVTSSISGYNPVHRIYQGWGESGGFNGWFYLNTSKPFRISGSFSDEGVFRSDSIANQKGAGVYAGFYLQKDEIIEIRTGTSFCNWQGAKANLTKEIGHQSFEQLKSKARAAWEKALGQIRIETNNEQQKKVFYTALYHCMQHPRLFNDVDGQYPRFAGKYRLQKSSNGNYYDDFSMWDIYRAQLPLFEILDPALSNAFIRSLIAKGEQGGWLPIFPCWNNYTAAMIGDHVAAYIAAAYNKGLRDFNVQSAYRLMRKNAFETPADFATYKNGMGRRALPSYLQFGFIPVEDSVPDAFHKKEQVSRTLEYAYDDYALFTLARALGKKEDQQLLRERAFNYRNIFSIPDGMVRGKHADGKWAQSFHPDIREFYITEGTPRQYSFYVPQDIPGLATLMGGDKAFENALDSLFLKNEYWHGNEPGHQIPFLYNYTVSPYKSQEKVRQILLEEYSDGPGGLSGNDDAGQMSAWYVFAAMGFYPVNPVSGEYIFTTPLFDHIQLQLPGGKKFSIRVHRPSANAVYIKQLNWNGKNYTKNYITYQMIMQGGQLDCWLSEQPGNWGTDPGARSKGLSNE